MAGSLQKAYRKNRDVLRKYEALGRRYRELVEKYERTSAQTSAVHSLAVWSMRTSESALALVRGGRILVANPRWHELDSGRRRGLSWELLDGAGGPARHLSDLAIALAADERRLGARPVRVQRQGGGQIIELRLESTEDADGTVLAIAIDATARILAEQALSEARSMLEREQQLLLLGEAAAGMAHDIGNALFAARVSLQSVPLNALDETSAEAIRRLDQAVQDALASVRRVSELGRRNGRQELEEVELRRLVSDVFGLAGPELSRRAARRGMRITLESAGPKRAKVLARGSELRLLLLNLLFNAEHAMPKGGTIVVRVASGRSGVSLAVEDEGVGIAPDHLHRIFEPFFTTREGGLGLGLAMAKSLMNSFGGTIAAENRPEGGAVFTLAFPPRPKGR